MNNYEQSNDMKTILTDYPALKEMHLEGFKCIQIRRKSLKEYENNMDITAIVGSRALACDAAQFDFPALKLIQLTSAGYEGVPCNDYAKRGIIVSNAGTVYSAPIAETVILGMLLMVKKLHSNPNNRSPKLQRHYSTITEIKDKHALILGTGNIGTAIAERLQGFEMTVDGYNRSLRKLSQFNRIINEKQVLERQISHYDFIISTLPETSETKELINAELIKKMSDQAIFINVGRQSVFDKDALYKALKTKKLGGAVLDMFEIIPNPIQNKFRRLNNTIVLPGVAAISQEAEVRLIKLIRDNLNALMVGEEIKHIINGL